MPLDKSGSKESVSKNIKTEMAAGKPQKQAVAIALNTQRHAKYDKGGHVCASNAKQFKQNIVETAGNPTKSIGFNKGGEVGWKKPSWRKW